MKTAATVRVKRRNRYSVELPRFRLCLRGRNHYGQVF